MKMHSQLFAAAMVGMFASCGTAPSTNDRTDVVLEFDTPVAEAPTRDTAETMPAPERAAPAPNGETAPVLTEGTAGMQTEGSTETAAPSPFAHLEAKAMPELAGTDATLPAGRFVGDVVLDQKGAKLTGAGPGETVIEGNLIVGSRCAVTGLTVTGDVIFRGNNSRAFVDCRGQFLDYGMRNRR